MTSAPKSDDEIDAVARRLGPLAPAPADELDLDALIAWRRGELDEVETAAVETRLAVDPEARAFVADLAATPSPFLARQAERRLESGTARWIILGTLLAAAAVVWLPGTRAVPPPYTLTLVRGAEVELRGDPTGEAGGPYRVDDEVTLTLAFAPATSLPEGTTLHAAAFVDVTGRLGPIEAGGVDPAGVWRLKAPTRALFGEGYGERTLYLALSHDPAPLARLAGRPTPADDIEGTVRWHRVRFTYRRSTQ